MKLSKYVYITPFLLLAGNAIALGFNTTVALVGAVVGGVAIGVAAVVGFVPAVITLAIGSVVAAITFSPTTNPADSPLVVQISPSAKLQTPSGYTPAGAGQIQPIPPSSVTGSTGYAGSVNGVNFSGASVDAACKDAYAKGGLGYPVSANSDGSATCQRNDFPGQPYPSYSIMSPSAVCPSGYTSNGASCALTDASKVMKPADNVCGILRQGNSFGTDPLDPDCTTIAATTGLSIAPQSVTAIAPDGSSSTVILNPDGSTTVYSSKPNTGGSTPTTTTTTTQIGAPDVNGDAKVVGQGTVTTNGAGVGASGAAVSNVTFDKSGLATEGTQNGIHADTTAIKDALNADGVDSTLQPGKDALDAAAAARTTAIKGIKTDAADTGGFQWPWSGSTILPAASCGCEPLSMSFHGFTKSFDWCPFIATFKSAMSYVLFILTMYTLLGLLIRK